MAKKAKRARKPDYEPVTVKHSKLEKQKWAMLKHKGKWSFAKARAARPPGPHTVCYYDPSTGFYDDCHETS